MTDNFPNGNGFGRDEDKFTDKSEDNASEEKQESGCNPYGQNSGANQSYYGQGYPPGGYYVRKPSLIKRMTVFFTDRDILPLSMASIAASVAIVLFRIFGSMFSSFIQLQPVVRALYEENYTFSMVAGMLYSLIGVGGTFFIAYLILKRFVDFTIPAGAPRKNSGVGYLVLAGLGICYVGNVAVSYMMSALSSVGISSYSYEAALTEAQPLPENAFGAICTVMYMAVFPAFFEEIAFRGVVMQPLRKYGDWFAIIVSAVMFGLVHGNIMQIPFAIVAGIALGYSSVVTGSLRTGMLIHFLNNFLSVIYSWARTGLSDRANMIFSPVFTYGIIVIGLVALAGYAYKNPDMLRLYPKKNQALSDKKFVAVYFLMPSMVIALVLLMNYILSDIVVR